eukprot:9487287-Pyramimonas_sp.AAC.1
MVIAGQVTGSPASRAACRAGFCPVAAVRTWPRMTSSTPSGGRLASTNNCRITAAPNSEAGIFESDPLKFPMAVRRAATMTTSSILRT